MFLLQHEIEVIPFPWSETDAKATWIKQFKECQSQSAVFATLFDSFSKIENKLVRNFGLKLIEGRMLAGITNESRPKLVFFTRDRPNVQIRLEEPAPSTIVNNFGRDDFHSFLLQFGGLSSVSDSGVCIFAKGLTPLESWGLTPNARSWSDSLVIYCKPNGDLVLFRDDGIVGCIQHDTMIVEDFADSFEHLLDHWLSTID